MATIAAPHRESLILRYTGDLSLASGVVSELLLPAGALLIVGRGDKCGLRLAGAHTSYVSRRHATLACSAPARAGAPLVVTVTAEAEARNGTYIDGVRLEEGVATELRIGAEVLFGGARAEAAAAAASAPPQPLVRNYAYTLQKCGAAASGGEDVDPALLEMVLEGLVEGKTEEDIIREGVSTGAGGGANAAAAAAAAASAAAAAVPAAAAVGSKRALPPPAAAAPGTDAAQAVAAAAAATSESVKRLRFTASSTSPPLPAAQAAAASAAAASAAAAAAGGAASQPAASLRCVFCAGTTGGQPPPPLLLLRACGHVACAPCARARLDAALLRGAGALACRRCGTALLTQRLAAQLAPLRGGAAGGAAAAAAAAVREGLLARLVLDALTAPLPSELLASLGYYVAAGGGAAGADGGGGGGAADATVAMSLLVGASAWLSESLEAATAPCLDIIR